MALLNAVPQLLEWMQQSLAPAVSDLLGVELLEFDIEGVRKAIVDHWRQVGSLAGRVIDQISRSGALVLGWITLWWACAIVLGWQLRRGGVVAALLAIATLLAGCTAGLIYDPYIFTDMF